MCCALNSEDLYNIFFLFIDCAFRHVQQHFSKHSLFFSKCGTHNVVQKDVSSNTGYLVMPQLRETKLFLSNNYCQLFSNLIHLSSYASILSNNVTYLMYPSHLDQSLNNGFFGLCLFITFLSSALLLMKDIISQMLDQE